MFSSCSLPSEHFIVLIALDTQRTRYLNPIKINQHERLSSNKKGGERKTHEKLSLVNM
jgi:hypothetical protein